MTAALHTPYSPSSPIARPFHQQQTSRHGSDASLYDGSFGYPYVGSNNTTVLGGTGGVRERAVSSSAIRPITPISPLSDHHHQYKDYYHRPSYPPPSLGGGRAVHDYVAADYNRHPSSTATTASAASTTTKLPPRSRGRRVSNVPTQGVRMFTCQAEGCGKVFKRSEHLKRHIRSIHTMEKPFECPYQSCHKRFSRSDNLNQHIRIHRHSNAGIKAGSTPVPTAGGGQGGAFPSTNLKDVGASSLTNKIPRATESYWQ
ncbi:hypothetical protein BX666DRAFT_1861828 [Dichotomocladium elegans]|nr:hypothetical protein BX666DRAFT_1861828 [Dichotomocladium elegans]